MKLTKFIMESQIKETRPGVFSLFDFDEKLVYILETEPCEQFLKAYPNVKKGMEPFVKTSKIMTGYKQFLKFKNKNEDKLGATPETVNSPAFGEKTFYKFNWPKNKYNGSDLGFADLFQYLYLRQRKLI